MKNKPVVLLVEDESSIADTVLYALRTDGLAAEWVATGGEALQCLQRGPVDLLILDIGLPDVNGFDLYREIRPHYGLPVIFLTARAEEVDRVAGLEMGADDYVVKPFSPRELSARVRTILRRTRSPGTDQNGAAPSGRPPFVIDTNRRSIQFFGQSLELSRYEYRILEILVAHPGWVYSRERLMTLIWDDPEMSLERTVDTHIKTLRAKLKAVRPGLEPILTHRGTGYSLREDW